jgi:CRISPR-associated protein Cas2
MMEQLRFNAYRIMWIFVMFDLPVGNEKERKAATEFRKRLLNDGFTMHQYSIYVRCCPSMEYAETHIRRIKDIVPAYGMVSIAAITDKQFSQIRNFRGAIEVYNPHQEILQLEMF